ncbi:MAG TPA: hypothetical protein EYP31_09230 [Roseibacterium sp.]|nr:hypothetical protein [Roseibacterium sp.]
MWEALRPGFCAAKTPIETKRKTTEAALRPLFLGILYCLFASNMAVAQNETPTFVINLFGLTATYEAPPWVQSKIALDEVEIFRQEGVSGNGTRVFITEYIPQGESIEAWTELYAIHAETPLSGSVDSYMVGMFEGFQSACDGALLQTSNTTAENVSLGVIFCPIYLSDPSTGEVAFVHLQMVRDILVRNYYHRRVPAFDPNVETPLSLQEIQRFSTTVAGLSLQ